MFCTLTSMRCTRVQHFGQQIAQASRALRRRSGGERFHSCLFVGGPGPHCLANEIAAQLVTLLELVNEDSVVA